MLNYIKNELKILEKTRDNIRQSILNKGVDMPEGTSFDDYDDYIRQIIVPGYSGKNFVQYYTNNATDFSRYGVYCHYYNDSFLDLRGLDVSHLTTLSIDGLSIPKVWQREENGYIEIFDTVRHSIERVSLKGLDISHITNISSLFSDFWRLEQLDLSGVDIEISLSTNCFRVIYNCYSLYKINFKGCSLSTIETILKYSELPQDYEGTDIEGMGYEGIIYVDEEILNNPPSIDIGNWKYKIATDWDW